MVRVLDGRQGLRSALGESLGDSSWVRICQADVNQFGQVTHDLNPLHLDPAAAQRAGFEGTIAHGFLSLSLIGGLLSDVFEVHGARTVLNYGVDRARFAAPLAVDSHVRLSVTLMSLVETGEWDDAMFSCTVRARRARRPACVAELKLRYFWS